VLLLLLEAAAALALVEYVRRELPALGAGAADAAATTRRATRHIRDDTCELTAIEAQHRLPSFSPSDPPWLPISRRIPIPLSETCVRPRDRCFFFREVFIHISVTFNHSSQGREHLAQVDTERRRSRVDTHVPFSLSLSLSLSLSTGR